MTFSFLHSYEATGRYWRGLEKAGLIRPHTGIRFVNSPFGDDSYRFNDGAHVNGELYKIIETEKRPLVIDRLVGGGPYPDYELDSHLLKSCDELLGDRFLGAQLHEVVCNVGNDWMRLLMADPDCRDRPIDSDTLRSYLNGHDSLHWLEQGKPESYAGRSFPKSIETFWEETIAAARRHRGRVAGLFCYCEGSAWGELAFHSIYREGARWCVAEVGPWASLNTQFTISALRGAAKAAGRPWGVSYAPWGPRGCTCFIPPEQNSWQAPHELLLNSGWLIGPEFGPSSALQRRLFFYSYLSGANALYEEWGAEDNLLDWDSGEISSYGKVTAELLDFQEANPDLGVPFTPVALVLDADAAPPVGIFDAPIGGKVCRWYEPREIDFVWSNLIRYLFGPVHYIENGELADFSGAHEISCLSPCASPCIFDIVLSDGPKEIWSDYQQVIAIGSGSAPECAERRPMSEQYGFIANTLNERSPFWRATDVTMQINRREADGAWIIGLFNPRGAIRGDVWDTGSILNNAFAVSETLHSRAPVRSARLLYGQPDPTSFERRGDDLHVVVAPGGVAIVEVVCE